VRIAWRTRFARRPAVEAVGGVIAARLRGFAERSAEGAV
jgi:LysR family hydrogen peroxide-inducible transcriptional activator